MNTTLIISLLRDFIFIFLLFFETSFTGSAGTTYKIYGISYGAAVYFLWFTFNMLISLGYNILALHRFSRIKPDFTSFWYYAFASLAIYQYGRQTAIDYQELGDYRNIWSAFSNIQTMGNNPTEPVPAEPIHWAMTELFVYVLVIQDFIYCFKKLQLGI